MRFFIIGILSLLLVSTAFAKSKVYYEYYDSNGNRTFADGRPFYGKNWQKKNTKKGKVRQGKKKFSKNKSGYSNIVTWKGHRMPSSVAKKLQDVERIYGKVGIISSCRPGATVKNTGRPSMHGYCRAVDFNPPSGTYSAVANYLKNTWSGGVGTYSGYFNHIHIDDNGGRWHN